MFAVPSGVRVPSRATTFAPGRGAARAATGRSTGAQRVSCGLRPIGTALPIANAPRGGGARSGSASARSGAGCSPGRPAAIAATTPAATSASAAARKVSR